MYVVPTPDSSVDDSLSIYIYMLVALFQTCIWMGTSSPSRVVRVCFGTNLRCRAHYAVVPCSTRCCLPISVDKVTLVCKMFEYVRCR